MLIILKSIALNEAYDTKRTNLLDFVTQLDLFVIAEICTSCS
jgi:hypothetical protein